MSGIEVGAGLIYSALITAAATAGATAAEVDAQHVARHAERQAQGKAETLQKQADVKAEKQRLEGLANNQTATDYANIWGTSGNKYADAAQKLSAGTGSFDTDEEETNPFYTRGLI